MTHTDLIRWEPFLRDTIAGRFNQFFSPTWRSHDRSELATWSPAVDIYDSGDALVLEAELPGFKKEDIDIRVENNVLMLSGERRRETGNGGTNRTDGFVRAERPLGPFGRTFALPMSVDHTRIEASYRDGILRLTMPKMENALPRRIDVKFH